MRKNKYSDGSFALFNIRHIDDQKQISAYYDSNGRLKEAEWKHQGCYENYRNLPKCWKKLWSRLKLLGKVWAKDNADCSNLEVHST